MNRMTPAYLGPLLYLRRGLRAGPNSRIWPNRITRYHQVQPKAVILGLRPVHSLIPCGTLGGTILAPNLRAGLEKSG